MTTTKTIILLAITMHHSALHHKARIFSQFCISVLAKSIRVRVIVRVVILT